MLKSLLSQNVRHDIIFSCRNSQPLSFMIGFIFIADIVLTLKRFGWQPEKAFGFSVPENKFLPVNTKFLFQNSNNYSSV